MVRLNCPAPSGFKSLEPINVEEKNSAWIISKSYDKTNYPSSWAILRISYLPLSNQINLHKKQDSKMGQASKTQNLAEQDAFKRTLALEPSIVIINAAITFAEPKNSSGSEKTRPIRLCLHRGERLLWPPPDHFLKWVPADSRQVFFAWAWFSPVRSSPCPERPLPGRHFLLCHLNLLLLLWFSCHPLCRFGQRALPPCSLCPMNLSWCSSPSTIILC